MSLYDLWLFLMVTYWKSIVLVDCTPLPIYPVGAVIGKELLIKFYSHRHCLVLSSVGNDFDFGASLSKDSYSVNHRFDYPASPPDPFTLCDFSKARE